MAEAAKAAAAAAKVEAILQMPLWQHSVRCLVLCGSLIWGSAYLSHLLHKQADKAQAKEVRNCPMAAASKLYKSMECGEDAYSGEHGYIHTAYHIRLFASDLLTYTLTMLSFCCTTTHLSVENIVCHWHELDAILQEAALQKGQLQPHGDNDSLAKLAINATIHAVDRPLATFLPVLAWTQTLRAIASLLDVSTTLLQLDPAYRVLHDNVTRTHVLDFVAAFVCRPGL